MASGVTIFVSFLLFVQAYAGQCGAFSHVSSDCDYTASTWWLCLHVIRHHGRGYACGRIAFGGQDAKWSGAARSPHIMLDIMQGKFRLPRVARH